MTMIFLYIGVYYEVFLLYRNDDLRTENRGDAIGTKKKLNVKLHIAYISKL